MALSCAKVLIYMDQEKKGRPWAVGVWSREAVLLTALASLGILFGVTEVAIGFYRSKQSQLAQMWFERGNSDLAANKPNQAVQDLRNAVSYAPDADQATYQLRLAQALVAANRVSEAESYLLDLWTNEPGSGEINFELAQIEARQGNLAAARYFDNAIYGVWPSNAEEHRWQARMGLFQFYRSRGNMGQAQAELVAMAADTPRTDYRRRTQIGQFQLQSGSPRQALEQFRIALEVKHDYAPALAGAGEAEFTIGEYRNAIPYLEAALRYDPKNRQAASQLALTRMVLNSDPFEIELNQRERTNRSIDAYLQALTSLANCATSQGIVVESSAPQNPVQRMWASGQSQRALLSGFRGQPQAVLQLMNFVFAAEDLVANECGPLQGKDKALWLIGRIHQLSGNKGQGAD